MKTSVIKRNSKLFKVLGHVKRLEIICLLQGHSLTVNQIVQMTALRQSTISQHLIALKLAHIVRTVKSGKEIYYSLDSPTVESISNFISVLTGSKAHPGAEPTVIDPICQMHLTPSTASYTTEYDGVRRYFCGKGCLKEFDAYH